MADHAETVPPGPPTPRPRSRPSSRCQRAAEAADAAARRSAAGSTSAPTGTSHTDLGRGSASAVGMVDAAEAAGLHTVGITDQVSAATVAAGLRRDGAGPSPAPASPSAAGSRPRCSTPRGRLDLPAAVAVLDHVVVTAVVVPERRRTGRGGRGPGRARARRRHRRAGGRATSWPRWSRRPPPRPARVVLGRPFSLLAELGLADAWSPTSTCSRSRRPAGARRRGRGRRALARAVGPDRHAFAAGRRGTARRQRRHHSRAVGAWRYLAALTGTSATTAVATDTAATAAAAAAAAAMIDADNAGTAVTGPDQELATAAS